MAGAARAASGLRRFDAAVAAQRAALARLAGSAPLQARLVEYLERGHRYADGARAAGAMGGARFPTGPALYPKFALEPPEIRAEDAQGPLSEGAGRLRETSLAWVPHPPFSEGALGGSGGTAVSDFSFIPEFRPAGALTRIDRWCPQWSQRRDLLLAGNEAQAVRGLPARFMDVRPGHRGDRCGPSAHDLALIRAFARLENNRHATAPGHVQDALQNLWRFAGDLRRARVAAEAWQRTAPDDPRPVSRAGEIAFVRGDHNGAARLFAKAVRLARARTGTWSLDEADALVDRGTALELAQRPGEAQIALAGADEVATRALALQSAAAGPANAGRGAFIVYNARAQSGDTFLRTRDFAAADEAYAAAREKLKTLSDCACTPGWRREVLDNNQALVKLRLTQTRPALDLAERAASTDPLNPLFQQTLGLARSRSGRPRLAEHSYRTALRSDPTLFPAANDLGIVLAGEHRYAQAASAFREAVSAQPGYAAGWFNLGIALERRGAGHVLSAQGSFARAFRLDDGLRTREHHFVSDDRIVFAKLDLSKPLPPHWSYASSQRRAPVAPVGFALALLLTLRLSRSLVTGGVGANARKTLDVLRERLSRLLGPTPAAVSVVATLAALTWPALHSDASANSVLLLLLGTLALIAIVLRMRMLAARATGVTLRQAGWAPAIIAALAATIAGAAWAPLPVAVTGRESRAVRWIGPLAAAAMGIALVALGSSLAVPATMALGTTALVMAASMLVPIKPLDGGFLGDGAAPLVTNILLAGVAVLVALGVA
jgi:tetratricopeptide (TPR) repeat protein